jgi:hypothetical protein
MGCSVGRETALLAKAVIIESAALRVELRSCVHRAAISSNTQNRTFNLFDLTK